MDFQPSIEQREFVTSIARLLSDGVGIAAARGWADGEPGPTRLLWRRLGEQGVLGLCAPLELSGVDASPVDLALAMEELGAAGVPGPLVESIAILPTVLIGTADAPQIEHMIDGSLMGTLAWHPHVPFALDANACDLVYKVDEGYVDRAEPTRELSSIDCSRRLGSVRASRRLGLANEPGVAFELGALATSAQQLGLGRAMLDQAIAYSLQRTQFGRQIGSFQAVKYQLANAAVGIEFARPLVWAAALSMTARDVSAAKVACAEAADRAGRAALQVHGAVGFSAEYDLAPLLTKARALRSAWGTLRWHRRRVLQELRPARSSMA